MLNSLLVSSLKLFSMSAVAMRGNLQTGSVTYRDRRQPPHRDAELGSDVCNTHSHSNHIHLTASVCLSVQI